ncbi:MAG TPA: molybdopterin dinucleotide binding domain-containing protein, partial [Thermoanaerobaculia bacterium]
VDPPGDARSELHFLVDLGRRLKRLATAAPRDAALRALTWDYRDEDADEVLREIHGSRSAATPAAPRESGGQGVIPSEVEGSPSRNEAGDPSTSLGRTRAPLGHFGELKNDGSTSCGCWIYSGVYANGVNRANEREPHGKYAHGWGYAWPLDRRILYNRASAKPDGTPWSERKKLVWWDAEKREWTGDDVPDFTRGKAPDYKPEAHHGGDEAIAGDAPFIMHPDGMGWLWVPSGLKDGPLPAHYEPLESNVTNPLYAQQSNPAALKFERPDNPYAQPGDFPYVLTTYRLTEHHTAGAMSRNLSHLAELQPELFAEISPELAREAGVANGDVVEIATARGAIRARALVTTRMPSIDIDGRRVHQVGLPYHWGSRGLVTGDVVNDLLAISEEPNVKIFESKGLTCSLRRA